MELIMLGTGNALVTECYNTCFLVKDHEHYFMVDAGGGNTILQQLKKAGVDWQNIRKIFVTHKHIDHILGIVWMIRMICQHMQEGSYDGEAFIYSHEEAISILNKMASDLLSKKQAAFIGERLHLVPVSDGEQKTILGKTVTFFDIHSTKAKQFGFSMYLENGEKLTCCGDEPYHECEERYVRGSKWLLHEAFCLYKDAAIFSPYEKHHSTVKDACELAESFHIENLLLYHTEDRHLKERKTLYLSEGKQFYHGNLFVPDDLERIPLL